MALTYTPEPSIGSICPDFSLPSTNGRSYSRKDFEGASAFLVMFICNHCPYVKAIEDRLISLGRQHFNSSVKIVAICSNDADSYPDDSFEKLKERAEKMNYPFPYLHDETQSVAKIFGAVCTPDFFLFDSNMALAYRGRLDDSWKDASQVKTQELKSAIEALVTGQRPSAQQLPSMGCNIKWKKDIES
jgi:peroxiredoxin